MPPIDSASPSSSARIVFLTIHSEEQFVEACRAEGALGYVVKAYMKAHLIPAIQAALTGESYISPLAAMNIRLALIGAALVLAPALFAREKTDVLVMKNGDRMTCQVKGLDAGVLYVSFDYIDGTASVEWSKVARLESDQLFIVKTEDGSVYTGKLRTAASPAGEPVKIEILELPTRQWWLKVPKSSQSLRHLKGSGDDLTAR